MVKQKIIKETQKSSYIENLIFDSANRFKSVTQPLSEANKYKGMLQKVTPQLFESRQRFNLRKEPILKVPIIPIDDAPGGMVPIGDSGWYVTPEEPADPTDCERYPDSPFCGGIPFSFKPIDIGLNIVIDQCNLGIRMNPVVAFIKLPPIAIAYRKPECRNVPQPEPPIGNSVPFPSNVCATGALTATVFYQNSYASTDHFYFQRNGDFNSSSHPYYNFSDRQCSYRYTEIVELVEHEIPYKGTPPPYLASFKYDFLIYLRFKHSITFEADNGFVSFSLKQNPSTPASAYNASIEFYQEHYIPNRLNFSSYEEYSFSSFPPNYNPKAGSGIVYIDTIANAKKKIGTKYNEYYYEPEPVQSFYYDLTNRFEGNEKKYKIEVLCSKLANNNPPPPVLVEPPEMNCCNLVAALVQKVDGLTQKVNSLSGVAKKVDDVAKTVNDLTKTTDKLSDAIGVEEYPASLPKSLISKDQGFLGNLIPDTNIEIKNLTSLFGWYIERFDEIMGQFEIPIEIKDSDPTKAGNQPVGIKVDNIAEGIAESMGLLLQIAYNTEAMLNINTRTLLETGGDKIQNFKTYMLLEALTEYVGFKFNEVEKKVALTFKPGESDLSKLLKEYEQPVIVADFDEKTDFQADLRKLMEAAAIIKARYFRKLDSNADPVDIKNAIMGILKQSQALGKKVNDNEEDANGDNSFDQFRNQVEEGFINEAGVMNTTDPYGKPYAERPKIRDVD